ncbi:MAG: CRISPR-associated protein Cas4 [Clostridia bacterium]|nr:CRISPR-associated protein Cas4 [Clostridia bacterium]
MAFDEEDWLPLSGLQHFAYCKRQWALMTFEDQWAENLRTTEGHLMHERAHDDALREKRGGLLVVRGLPVHSREMGVSGQCDVGEFRQNPDGVALAGEAGCWMPTPVEYKRGSPKVHDADRLQLCCQAMCLEEMLLCEPIRQAYLYYGETAHREAVTLDMDLRDTVRTSLTEMHAMAQRKHTPKVKPNKGCNACSLKDMCLPSLLSRQNASAYIRARLAEAAPQEVPPCEN